MANSDSPQKQGSNSSRESSRDALLLRVRSLIGGSLQKIWLASSTLAAMQLRTPGLSSIVAIDVERAMALVADERPASPEIALKAQATLRAALSGARFDAARLVLPIDAPENARHASLRLELTTPSGPRALLADPRAKALVLTARSESGSDEKIIWAAPGAAAAFRPGAQIEPWREAPAANASAKTGGEFSRAQDAASADAASRALSQEMLDARVAERFAAEKQTAIRALKTQVQKISRTLEAVERDSVQAAKAIEARRFAELLLPQQSKIARGASVAVVPDWSQLDDEGNPAQISIALDPALGAAANASRMLKKAQRYTAAGPRIAARLAEVSHALDEAKAQLARTEDANDTAQLRGANANSTQARTQPAPAHRAKNERLPYRAFRSSNGARIFVGRSAKDNDTLTLKWAKGDDLWLHARGIHGSHVILLDPGTAPDTRALAEAALLAAHFSSARGADGAEVSWTRRKYVRKGKGLAPGAVTFSQEKTLRVRLDEALLHALLAREE